MKCKDVGCVLQTGVQIPYVGEAPAKISASRRFILKYIFEINFDRFIWLIDQFTPILDRILCMIDQFAKKPIASGLFKEKLVKNAKLYPIVFTFITNGK